MNSELPSATAAAPLRYASLWLGAGLLSLVVVLGMSLAPLSMPLPHVGGDKLTHFTAFAALTLWFLGAVHTRQTPHVLLALTCYGVLIEYLQSLTPYRYAEFADVLADVGGIGAGWLLSALGLRQWCAWIEGLLPQRR